MPPLLAIDPGANCGWAVSADGRGVAVFGTWRLRLTARRGSAGRLLQLEQLIDAAHARYGLGMLAYERPFVGTYPAVILSLGELAGTIKLWAVRRDLPCFGYEPKEIKRSIAGGRAKKEQMIAAVRALGYPVEDDHQADAVACALLALSGARPAQQVHREIKRAKKRGPDLFTRRRAA